MIKIDFVFIILLPFSHSRSHITINIIILSYINRVVKLSSPNLNYFIIVGAMLMYSSIYFYLLPVANKNALLASCIVSITGIM